MVRLGVVTLLVAGGVGAAVILLVLFIGCCARLAGVLEFLGSFNLKGLREAAVSRSIHHSIRVARQLCDRRLRQRPGLSRGELTVTLLVSSYEQGAVGKGTPAAAQQVGCFAALNVELGLEQAIAEAEAMFNHPYKQYMLFKDFEQKVSNRDIDTVPDDFGSKMGRQQFGETPGTTAEIDDRRDRPKR